MAHAAGLLNLRSIWEDSRIKRKMDRAVQAKALGVTEALASEGNEEMPGDISIKGDETRYETHNHYHQPATSSPPTTNPIVSAVTETAKRRLWPIIMASALSGGAVASIPLVYQWFYKPTPSQAVSIPNYSLDLKVTDQP